MWEKQRLVLLRFRQPVWHWRAPHMSALSCWREQRAPSDTAGPSGRERKVREGVDDHTHTHTGAHSPAQHLYGSFRACHPSGRASPLPLSMSLHEMWRAPPLQTKWRLNSSPLSDSRSDMAYCILPIMQLHISSPGTNKCLCWSDVLCGVLYQVITLKYSVRVSVGM